MSSGRPTVRDLAEEAKKRVVLLLICVFGLSYLMSLTSSSVWVNLPAAAAIILFFRYISLDFDVRRRNSVNHKQSSDDQSSRKKPIELLKFPLERPNWRLKVNSPAVEAAIEQFTRHLVSEWVTDLWDIINLFCNHLEMYRLSQVKIEKQKLKKLSTDYRDIQLRLILADDGKLHPALFSSESEHKVLQQLLDGLISLTFKPEDLQCYFFRYTVRELLACAVFRPVLNLACPRVINEKIESLVLSVTNKADKGVKPSSEEVHVVKPNGSSKAVAAQFSGFQDRSTVGVELVQFKHDKLGSTSDERVANKIPSSVNYTGNVASDPKGKKMVAGNSGGEWAQALDMISQRKSQALAPEHFENIWTKGRNYIRKEIANQAAKVTQNTILGISDASHYSTVTSNHPIQDKTLKVHVQNQSCASSQAEDPYLVEHLQVHPNGSGPTHTSMVSSHAEIDRFNQEEVELNSDSSYPTDDDESNIVTGLDGQDILNVSSKDVKAEELADQHEVESWGIVSSRAAASSIPSTSTSEFCGSSLTSPENSVLADSFLKLRCEVLGANIVKSGSVTFAVYSIAVTDANNNSWSIKRRLLVFEGHALEPFNKPFSFLYYSETSSASNHFWIYRVHLEDKLHEKNSKDPYPKNDLNGQIFPTGESLTFGNEDYKSHMNQNYFVSDNLGLRKRTLDQTMVMNVRKEEKDTHHDYSGSDSEKRLENYVSSTTKSVKNSTDTISRADDLQETSHIVEASEDSIIPTESQAFWVAKQLLQLGMGDAFDDWLIQKIQLLRSGSVITSAIKRLEQILWPDGIFLTKHPNRKPRTPVPSPKAGGNQRETKENLLTGEQQLEAARRAKFVHELIIDKAPAALVSLVGEKSMKDVPKISISFFSPMFV
ncbi:hypothetical protein J5N97_004627 [Dioscorea zingiberensis]|uniref:PXA domain-containing protein n=1 Tax=Dioscorea zingiberensis TaxID=325984 RepID=A0A9D5D6K5_9LILI|nr:hypothetical protein J5N97_004627 [Dioscorea zingiberensis]